MIPTLFRSRKRPAVSKNEVPFPTRQLFILALCRICEPIAFMSIFPYVYFMIASFNITTDDRQISVYAGMVTSAFAFAEFSTGVLWGRLSDVVGRKPILLTGLAGTGLSMIVFGFAPNLQVALLARALGGLLNGNIGVLQTTVAEVVKVKEHQPRAYAIMPFVWCLGSIVGSALGGCLADPVRNYPNVFAKGTIFERYPFLLPNLVCASVVVCGLIIGILFLEETHEKKKHRRDYGRELGSLLLAKVLSKCGRTSSYSKLDEASIEESVALIDDDLPPGYSSEATTATSTPRRRSSSAASDSPSALLKDEVDSTKSQHSVRKAFTPQVLLHVVAYGILAFEESDTPPVLPFKFEGGYGFPSSKIGFILSLQGVYQMVAQMIIFPAVVRRLGPLRLFRLVAVAWGFLYLAVPYLVLLPHVLRLPGLAVVLICKVTLQSLSYPSNALLLANSAPSMMVLGIINGVAASAASLCRAFGPTLSGVVQSAGSSAGYSGLGWWVSGIIAAIGAAETLYMREPPGRPDLEKPSKETKEIAETTETSAIALGEEEKFEHTDREEGNTRFTNGTKLQH